MGLVKILFFVNNDTVLDDGKDAVLPVFRGIADDDLVEEEVGTLGERDRGARTEERGSVSRKSLAVLRG